MQNLNIYSVYDAAAEAFMRPFFAPTNGLAIRSFASAVNDPQHDFFRHADDFTLFLIGAFSDDTGKIAVCTPESLGSAVQYRERIVESSVKDVEENQVESDELMIGERHA